MPRKKANNQYWSVEQDEALKAYLATDDMDAKNKIFEEKLYAPLNKLCEVWTAKSCSYMPQREFHSEILCHLVTKILPKIDYNRKGSAFSLLTLAARHFSWQLNNKKYKEFQTTLSDAGDSVDEEKNGSILDSYTYSQWSSSDFLPENIDYERLAELLTDKVDKKTLSGIINKHAKDRSESGALRNSLCIILNRLGSKYKIGGKKFKKEKSKKKFPGTKCTKHRATLLKNLALQALDELEREQDREMFMK